MATQTEAACLLESGALYGQRLLLRHGTGDPIFAGFKTGAFSLYFGDSPIYHFDLEGRWQRAYCDDRHYLKALDTFVQSIDRQREGKNLILKRKTSSPAETSALDQRVRATALNLLESLDSGQFDTIEPPSKAQPLPLEELREFLRMIANWDAEAWSAHRDAFLSTYATLPFLPPDCPSPAILQATLGHEGGVAFGNAPAAEHSVRSLEGFEEHARSVSALLGRRVEQCKSIFLGGSDVLGRPVEQVAGYLATIARVFPKLASNGVHVFVDRFERNRPGLDALREFQSLGLVRVCLGVESGDPAVRTKYRKTWIDETLRSLVLDLKNAGLGVSLMTLVGVGANEERHLDATAALIGSLDLGPGDLVSILDAAELARTGGEARPDDLKSRLDSLRSERKVKVVTYSLEKQGLS